MDKIYNPKEFALSLGFTESEAKLLGWAGADATNIRQVAKAKGLIQPKTKPETSKAKVKETAS